MNRFCKKALLMSAVLFSVAGLVAQTPEKQEKDISNMTQEEFELYLNTVQVDTTVKIDSSLMDGREIFSVRALARPKGDSIVLRWAPDQYAPWVINNEWGYTIVRTDEDFNVDTILRNKRPMSLEQMKKHFALTDSLAGAAAQLLYGKGTAIDSVSHEGSDAILRIYEEQQTKFAYAMLMSEIRPDIAEAMALKFTDKNVVPGKTYQYLVIPGVPDSILRMRTVSVLVKNDPYVAPDFNPEIKDSIGPDGRSIRIYWPRNVKYTTYDIERRYNGGDWKKLNNRPFLTLMTYEDESAAQNIFMDENLEVGTYEYRVKGYDSFGDGTKYSDVHKTELPDLIGPGAPSLDLFYIDRKTEGKIFADIHWTKQVFEKDFTGFDIYYYNPELSKEWRKLNQKQLAPTDTVYRLEVTSLSSGLVTVAAVDTAGNFSPSIPHELHISDLTPPSAPTGLSYSMSPFGQIIVKWNKNPEPDVYRYQLFSANDTLHEFQPMAGKLVSDTIVTDTIQVVGVNQKYLYYRLKAYDFSGNESEFSEYLQVKRKNYDAPEVCRIDSTWQDAKTVYMRWIGAHNEDVDFYRLFRRPTNKKQWTLVQKINADSIKTEKFVLSDSPEYDMENKYLYCMEAVNTTGISSGLSAGTMFTHRLPMIVDIPIEFNAVFDAEKDCIDMNWTPKGKIDDRGRGWYYLVQWKKDKNFFRTIETPSSEETKFRTRKLRKGETATFRVQIRFKDGRKSTPSNEVVITNTLPVEEKAKPNK